MRVEGVIKLTYTAHKQKDGLGYNNLLVQDCQNNKYNNLTFTAIKTHGEFRALTHNHIIRCPYCKRPMIYIGDITAMQKDGIFSGDVKTFVEKISRYRKYIKPTNKIILDKIEKYARKAPQTTLSTIIQSLYTNSLRRLRRIQTKIFKELIEESKNLPAETQKDFQEFIGKQYKRLYEEPHIEKFHGKSFKYKVNKVAQSFSSNEDLKNYITRIVSRFDEPILKDDNAILPDDIIRTISSKFIGKNLTAKEAKLYVINRLQRIGDRFDRKDIVELCRTSEKMVNGLPVIINFSNKEFMHDLVKYVLENHQKTDIYRRMIQIAQKLPSSKKDFNSFIVKWRYSNSDLIATKLLEPSGATIEHVKATSEGGLDIPSNWVLACKEDNNRRMSTVLYKFLKQFSPRNPQAYFNDIVEIEKAEGTFSKTQIESMVQTFEDEGHVNINLSRLKS